MYSQASTGTMLMVDGIYVTLGGDCGPVTLGSRVLSNLVGGAADGEVSLVLVSITLGSLVLLFSVRDEVGDGEVFEASVLSIVLSGCVRLSCIANSCSALRIGSPSCSNGYVVDGGLHRMGTMSPAAWRK